MGDITSLCYDYATTGYLVRLVEECVSKTKDKKQIRLIKEMLNKDPMKKLVDEIHSRTKEYFPEKTCKNCNVDNEQDAKFCKGCGKKLTKQKVL